MWLIFICSAICIFCATMLAIWLANKVLIGIKRDNHEYELELNNNKRKRRKLK